MTKIMTTTLTAKMVLISLPPVGLLSLGCSVSGEPPPTLDWFKYDFFSTCDSAPQIDGWWYRYW